MIQFASRSGSLLKNPFINLRASLSNLQNKTGHLRHCSAARFNEVNIQMLQDELFKQIFPHSERKVVDAETLERIEKHLSNHGLWGKSSDPLQHVPLKLPDLQGPNIDLHFRKIAEDVVAPYQELAEEICTRPIPSKPDLWAVQSGWTRYNPDGSYISVDSPQCKCLVFDVEVLMCEGQFPTLATAVSADHWYSWVSPRMFQSKADRNGSADRDLNDMVPLETNSHNDSSSVPRLIIGHNVGFDRSFIKEQYYIEGSEARFVDTMSLHIATSGMTSTQRILYVAKQKGNAVDNRKEVRDLMKTGFLPSFEWVDDTSTNSLKTVHQHYCPDEPTLEKESRDIFLQGTMEDVIQNFQGLMQYCATDVSATHSVFKKLWPSFQTRCPHPVTTAGMLEMLTAYLPVNSGWKRYIKSSNEMYEEKQTELRNMLMKLANEARELEHSKRYEKDLWLWDLDWLQVNTYFPKTPEDLVLHNLENEKIVDESKKKKARIKYSYPKWFKELCPFKSTDDSPLGPSRISTQRRVTPKLLRLTWEGYPLHYDTEHGWGYLRLDPDYHEEEKPHTGEEKAHDSHGDAAEEVSQKTTEIKDVASNNKFPLEVFKAYCREWEEKRAEDKLNPSPEITELKTVQLKMLEIQAKLEQNLDDDTRVKLMRELRNYEKYMKEINMKPKKATSPVTDGKKNIGIPGVIFIPLPHKNGPKYKVGNPLAKDFIPKIESGQLRSDLGERINGVLRSTIMCSYWKNNMKRIMEQVDVRLPADTLSDTVKSSPLYKEDNVVGAILPRIIPAGTITRRAVEQTWLTASNAYHESIGSELKAMIQTPPGYCFIGADVDSQELWIAAILGDAHFAKVHGCTALGWMTLQGSKAEGTDLHSKTADLVGISRDHAKVFNYARLYGAGQQFAQRLLMQFNPNMTEAEAKRKAKHMHESTKGKQTRRFVTLKGTEEEERNGVISKKLVSSWQGGSESATFNKLEEIARSPDPSTPVLNCKISRALVPDKVQSNFMTSRCNWVVQSSAVDYLHLLLVCMRYLIKKYDIQARFSISIHDEVRYLVAYEDRYRAALALQITNLMTRAMFAYKLNMNDLPQSVAFFSTVEIDRCLRKEAHLDCVTPSNPLGLEKGYNIPPGKAVTIHDILKKTGGVLHRNMEENTEESLTNSQCAVMLND